MPQQFFIIDGYNFLHAAGMIPRHVGPATLGRSRKHLLHYLESHLTDRERANTTIVFDVHQPKSDILCEEFFAEMTIINAVNYPDADTCIEELIRKHSAAKQVTVVSSDHRLHKAARTRKAKPIDSEDFFEYLQSRTDQPDASRTSKSSQLQSFEYPAEDLPLNAQLNSETPTSDEDLKHWEKRINELFEEE